VSEGLCACATDCMRACGSVRVRTHAALRLHVCGSVYGGVCSCVCVFVFVCKCVFICVRTHWVRVRAFASAHACCLRMCISIGLHLRARVCAENVCVCVCVCVCVVNVCACAAELCAHTRGTAATRGIARPVTRGRPRVRVCVGCHRPVARVGRRCDVHESYNQRAVGCAMVAHDRDQRHRRHLRHRRPRRQRPRRHLLQ
jgi:hypothetical protein